MPRYDVRNKPLLAAGGGMPKAVSANHNPLSKYAGCDLNRRSDAKSRVEIAYALSPFQHD